MQTTESCIALEWAPRLRLQAVALGWSHRAKQSFLSAYLTLLGDAIDAKIGEFAFDQDED